ncbi:glycosyl transferase family, helical bundle domain protein [Mycobacterium ulcerans str. Harvey]|uniref:Glycosyl transferase family, helical bundle domain protein n=1 Tax=Mycobacterium ulcerans str. Harvey TaxID=1299332 RepID=A0ABP3AMZ8_MYCUL|nr:glycosyl transferase family, helical bundle domain protein [Mycobacterium ulcerans str. Harvey]
MTDFEFDAPTVIRIKRDGGRLSDAAIDWVIDAYTEGRVAPEQMSALLMAIVLQGMDRGETARWTSAMLASGPRLDFSDLRAGGAPLVTVDKHSTGGVGTRSRCRWCLSSSPVGALSRRRRVVGSATPAAPWTNWNPSVD